MFSGVYATITAVFRSLLSMQLCYVYLHARLRLTSGMLSVQCLLAATRGSGFPFFSLCFERDASLKIAQFGSISVLGMCDHYIPDAQNKPVWRVLTCITRT